MSVTTLSADRCQLALRPDPAHRDLIAEFKAACKTDGDFPAGVLRDILNRYLARKGGAPINVPRKARVPPVPGLSRAMSARLLAYVHEHLAISEERTLLEVMCDMEGIDLDAVADDRVTRRGARQWGGA